MTPSNCLHRYDDRTNDHIKHMVKRILYDCTEYDGDEFIETAIMAEREGCSIDEARSWIADDIECRLKMIRDDLYENATPIQRLCILDIDAIGLDYYDLADGFLEDYEPGTIQSFNARTSAEGRGGIGWSRRSHGGCRP